MKKSRPKKQKQETRYTLASFANLPQPPGENFHLISITLLNDPTNPKWDQAYSVFGSWEQAKRTAYAMLDLCSAKPIPGIQIKIDFYQGDSARKQMRFIAKEEMRYQQEQTAVAAN